VQLHNGRDLGAIEVAVGVVLEEVAVGVDVEVAAKELRAVRPEAFEGFNGDGEDGGGGDDGAKIAASGGG